MKKKQKKEWLEECFQELERPLILYSYQIVKNHEDAKDLVQETFLRLSKQEDQIELPKAWLYTTLRNLSISFLRKNGRIQNSADEEQLDFLESMNENKQSSMLSEFDKKEAINRVKHAISLLPMESREILSLKFEEQKSYKEIAQATGLSIGNVGYKIHHIVKELAQELKEEQFFK
ncbi:MAG: hypothetical protein CMI23_09395 [Opitutae bacterium]|nr:hypothetical protein [Opitutae bacterium]